MRYANIGNYIRAGSLGAAGALGALAATQSSSPDFANQQMLALNLQGQREVLIQDLENPDKAYLSKVAAASNAAFSFSRCAALAFAFSAQDEQPPVFFSG